MEAEPRRSPRIPFIAAAEIIEVDTEVRLTARTGDLSQGGCYMDMVNPLPRGTAVKVVIAHGDRTFDATARVVYSQTPLGMGLEFREIDPTHQPTLGQWLAE
jgi:PilZ domain